jgi:hypothetical protein
MPRDVMLAWYVRGMDLLARPFFSSADRGR